MHSHDKPETTPTRRRIIQQPLRTEPARALISADAAQTAELEAVLKRDRALNTFPSLSHFFAERRREPWAAVVVARAGAWDPRFDSHVRRRGSIALFAVSEEVYGWPEAVARVRDLSELGAWLEALDAPVPTLVKAAKKRERGAQAKAAFEELSAKPLRQSTPAAAVDGVSPVEGANVPVSAIGAKHAARPLSAAPPKARAKPVSKSVQLALAIAEPQGDPLAAGMGPRVAAKPRGPAARKGAKRHPAPERANARSAREPIGKSGKQRPPHVGRSTVSSQAAERTFMLLAAELGLIRAGALLDALQRAARLKRR
jgi:hypothetical protein